MSYELQWQTRKRNTCRTRRSSIACTGAEYQRPSVVLHVTPSASSPRPNGRPKTRHQQGAKENQKVKVYDVGQIRTDAPEGTRFLVLRDNHSATTPDDLIDEKF